MNRYAFFVEGQTESLFVRWFLQNLARALGVEISYERRRAQGGKKSSNPRCFYEVEIFDSELKTEYFFLIIDCGNDAQKRIVGDIRLRINELEKKGYTRILAIRDLYPKYRIDQLVLLKESMGDALNDLPIDSAAIIAVMEIEAWFIAEYSHFLRMHSDLTDERIEAKIGFDLRQSLFEEIEEPANTLNHIYQEIDIEYDKNLELVERILNSMSFKELIGVGRKESELKFFVEQMLSLFDKNLVKFSVE